MKLKLTFILTLLLMLMFFLDPGTSGVLSALWNVVFLSGAIGLCVLLFNRLWFSVALVTSGFAFLLMADRAKFYFMDDHLRWSDMMNVTRHFDSLSGLRQFVMLMSQYAAGLASWKSVVVIAALSLLVAAAFKLEGRFFQGGHPVRRMSLAIVAMIAVMLLAPPTARTLFQAAYAERLTASNYGHAGMPMFFFASKEPRVDVPETLVPVSVHLDAPVAQAEQHPDIILWFNESTFDPRDLELATFETGPWQASFTHQDLALFEPGDHTVHHGRLDVGIFGGKSWNTVFALQAGAPVDWFSDDTYAASSLSHRVDETLFRKLKAAGYDIEALYAQDGYLFDAAKSQLDYGADRFYGSEFVAPSDQSIGRATDAETSGALERLLNKPSDRPRAFFVFTMANHGPYPAHGFVPTPQMRAHWGNVPEGVLDYLTRAQTTAQVLKNLEETMQNRARPTILLHLGDHKPRISGVEFSQENKFQTYYQILANFEPPRAIIPGAHDTDVMFLGAMILDLADIDTGPLFGMNRVLERECRPTLSQCSDYGQRVVQDYQQLAFENLRY